MAGSCYARRLSELLEEQQEPFFLVHRGGALQRRSVAVACGRRLRGLCKHYRRGVRASNDRDDASRSMLCGSKAASTALFWDLAGCFSCGAREMFRRLPRSGDIGGDEDRAGGRQLSPVSVLQLRSDEEEESTEPSHCNWNGEDESKPSTPASSPSESMAKKTEQQAIVFVSAWEKIAADISRIPKMVELDLSGSSPEWRRRIGEEEARRVGESVEAIIFEEVRWEAVRDMLCS